MAQAGVVGTKNTHVSYSRGSAGFEYHLRKDLQERAYASILFQWRSVAKESFLRAL